VTDRCDVFLSYSRNDLEAATLLLGQLKKAGLEVFRDQESIREGELCWRDPAWWAGDLYHADAAARVAQDVEAFPHQRAAPVAGLGPLELG
jgi:hypothetical protein